MEPLIEYFLEWLNDKYQRNIKLGTDAIEFMKLCPWPGNIRELENFIERVVVISTKNEITRADLLTTFYHDANLEQPVFVNRIVPLNEAIVELERQMVVLAYNNCKNSYVLAETLGISQSSAHRKIQKYIKKTKSN
ncbi:MAG: hypothetical protein AAGU27_25500 [Dehalobacterium sp.]